MYRHLELDLSKLALMHARGLSDKAIGRVLRCSRGSIYNYRHSLGLGSKWGSQARRRAEVRIELAKLDALWARLPLEAKRRLLLVNDGRHL